MTTRQPWPPPRLSPIGFIVYFYPGDVDWPIVLQVAPEDSGNPGQPDAAAAEEIQLPGDTESHVIVKDQGSGPWFFRWQHRLTGCSAGAFTAWWRGDPMVVDDVPPRPPRGSLGSPGLEVSQTSADFREETWEASASPPPDLPDGALEIRTRQRREGRDWPAWGAWQPGTTLQETVARHLEKGRFVQFQARDASLADPPVTEAWTERVKPLLDFLDLPPLARGPVAEDYGRDGFAGEVPGSGRQKAPLYSRDGGSELYDTVARRIRNSDLDRGITQTDGGGNFALSKGARVGGARDGVSVTFLDEVSVSYNAAPEVHLLSGGLSKDDANLSGNQYGPKFQALNVTKTGFDPSLVLREPTAGSPTPETASWSAGATQDFEASKSTSGDVVDDEFTYRYHVFIGGNEIGGDCLGATQTVGHYVHKGVGWSQHSTAQYSSSCSDFDSDVSQPIAESGMEEGDESFGITKESGGGTLNPPNSGDDVSWEEGGTIETQTATPGGASDVPFVVQSVAT